MKTTTKRMLLAAALTIASLSQAYAFYDSHNGRFASRDPLGEPSSVNLHGFNQAAPVVIWNAYAFVDNDSINFVDIDGRQKAGANEVAPFRLVIESVKPPKATSDCGGAESEVRFRLDNATGKNGWLIQHLVFEIRVTDCKGTPVPGKHGTGEYWEAWQVVNGNIYAGEKPTTGTAILHSGDLFGLEDQGKDTKGTIKKTGYVGFFANYNLTRPPWGSLPQAGGLPSMQTAPFPWNDSGMLSHYLSVEFDCCCRPYAKPIVKGLPWWQ